MNSPENNEKNIEKLEQTGKIYTDDQSEKHQSKIDEVTKEPPLAFPRRVVGWICIALWVFSIVMLMMGQFDFSVAMPFMMFGLGAYAALNIPVFIQKGKIFDIVVCCAATAVCFIVAVGLLVYGGSQPG